jgi:hypothetical protein
MHAIRDNRKLFAELGCPKELKRLSIPSFRDYMLRTTISPELVLHFARIALENASATNSEQSSPDLVACANRVIDILEANYRHEVRPR